MKQVKNYLSSKFVWQTVLILVAFIYFFPDVFSLAAYSPINYFQTTYEPVVFSKTEITIATAKQILGF